MLLPRTLPSCSCGQTPHVHLRNIHLPQAAGLAIMEAEVISLTLPEHHMSSGHSPGTYAAIVMPRCIISLSSLGPYPQHVLAAQGSRLERAVEHIHSLGLVHMDIKVGCPHLCDRAARCRRALRCMVLHARHVAACSSSFWGRASSVCTVRVSVWLVGTLVEVALHCLLQGPLQAPNRPSVRFVTLRVQTSFWALMGGGGWLTLGLLLP